MPVIILSEDSRIYLDKLSKHLSEHFTIIHLNGEFRDIRNKLNNMNSKVLYIIENCYTKSERYEIYCLVKKNKTSYCIITNENLSGSKHDAAIFNFNIGHELPIKEIQECLKIKLSSTVHEKRSISSKYMIKLKNIINKINSEVPEGAELILKSCEDKIIKIVQLNSIELDEIEGAYRKIIQCELKNKGMVTENTS